MNILYIASIKHFNKNLLRFHYYLLLHSPFHYPFVQNTFCRNRSFSLWLSKSFEQFLCRVGKWWFFYTFNKVCDSNIGINHDIFYIRKNDIMRIFRHIVTWFCAFQRHYICFFRLVYACLTHIFCGFMCISCIFSQVFLRFEVGFTYFMHF